MCQPFLATASNNTHSSKKIKYSFLVSKASTSWRMLWCFTLRMEGKANEGTKFSCHWGVIITSIMVIRMILLNVSPFYRRSIGLVIRASSYFWHILSASLTSSRSVSHSWQLFSLCVHPFCWTFCRCTSSRCSCLLPGISHKIPLCRKQEACVTPIFGRTLAFSKQIYSRLDDLSEVILVGHLGGAVVILLLPECQTTKWHGSLCPRQGASCHSIKESDYFT